MEKFENLNEEKLIEMLNKGTLSQEDMPEFIKAMEKMGLSGSIMAIDDPNSKEGRDSMEYVRYHEKISNDFYKDMPEEQIVQAKKTLLSHNSFIDDKKIALIVLAHAKSQDALQSLEEYAKNPDFDLRNWSAMALQECKGFLNKVDIASPTVTFAKIKSVGRNDPCPCGSGKKYKKCCYDD